ncbi:hypothetical protein L1887_16656 [Cichorium endivia]|nr:hypothetical protein L1887_16656 [Cichorium endivia]
MEHIVLYYHFFGNHVAQGFVNVSHIESTYHLVDALVLLLGHIEDSHVSMSIQFITNRLFRNMEMHIKYSHLPPSLPSCPSFTLFVYSIPSYKYRSFQFILFIFIFIVPLDSLNNFLQLAPDSFCINPINYHLFIRF